MRQIESSIPDALRLHPGQQDLTPEQEEEARHFANAYIQVQLSTEPVDEPEAEVLLRQAYEAAGLAAPQRIHWVDGPLQLETLIYPVDTVNNVSVSLRQKVEVNIWRHLAASIGPGVLSGIEVIIGQHVALNVWREVGRRIWDSLKTSARTSVAAYHEASWLALFHFYTLYFAPNSLDALARFSKLVSGYWLGQEVAIIIRRPDVLSRDAQGWLYSATSRCVGYRDGWGFCAWHGVLVPDKVILAPERLSREDFLNEPNLEVRRVIQERMGDRFVSELGHVIEHGPRGTLYEVQLLDDDWEQVARYVQVQDASTLRTYFLRVPPTIQTAAEAVAWSFSLSLEEYNPVKET